MKIKDFCSRMNNHGTHPHIRIYKTGLSGKIEGVLYEGNPNDVPVEIKGMPLTSFTVNGIGRVSIYTV